MSNRGKFLRALAMLLALILALPTGTLAEVFASDQAAAEGSPVAIEAQEAQSATEPEISVEAEAEPDPEPEDSAEGDAVPEEEAPSEPPQEAEQPPESEPEPESEPALRVGIVLDESNVLCAEIAYVGVDLAPVYQWQAAETAELLAARDADAPEDELEQLWADVEGANDGMFDAILAFGDSFADYSYRCRVNSGEIEAFSDPFQFPEEEKDADSEGELADADEAIPDEAAPEAEATAHPVVMEIDANEEPSGLHYALSSVKIGKGEKYLPELLGREGAGAIRYASSKPKLFYVDPETGEIEGLSAGKGKLTATAVASSASVTVQVCAAPKKLSLSAEKLTLGVSETATLEAKLPKGSYGHITKWENADANIASVEGGVVTAVAPGSAKITATLYNGKQASCDVTVCAAPSEANMKLELPEGNASGVIGVGESVQVALRYENAAGAVTYRSSEESVASVDAKGKIKGLAPGRATIIAEAYNKTEARVEVEVKAKPGKLAFVNAPKALGIGEPWTLEVKLSHKSGADCGGSVSFKSSKPSVLAVDKYTGALTAKKAGKAKITATSYNKLKKSVTITVKQAPTSVTLSAEKLEIGMEQRNVKLTVAFGGKKQFGNVHWASADERIATVNAKGELTAVSPGETQITATVYNPASLEEPFVRRCALTVRSKPTQGNVELHFTDAAGNEKLTLGVGETMPSKLIFRDGGGGGYTLSSNKKAVASVDKSGNVKGKKAGTATITAKTYNGIQAKATVQVIAAPAKIALTNLPDAPIPQGEQWQLGAQMTDKKNKPVTGVRYSFETSDPEVLSVDPDTGLLTAVSSSGSAWITVRTYNGKSASAEISVTKPLRGISLDRSQLVLMTGQDAKLTAKLIDMPGVRLSDIAWRSSNAAVASVSGGLVTAQGLGTATITASVRDPDDANETLSAECAVTVEEPHASISLDQGALTVTKGRTAILTATLSFLGDVEPEEVIWSSDDEKIATVSNGVVYGVEAGRTTVRASVEYPRGSGGKLSAECSVKVESAPSGMTLNYEELRLMIGDTALLWVSEMPGSSIATYDSVWSSSDEEVATVQSGFVTALSEGVATILLELKNRDDGKVAYSAECDLSVEGVNPEMTLNRASMALYVGQSEKLVARLIGIDTGADSVRWSSSAPGIATVEGGTVTAVAPGSAQITAEVDNPAKQGGALRASCEVTVSEQTAGLELTWTKLTMTPGAKVLIEAKITGVPEEILHPAPEPDGGSESGGSEQSGAGEAEAATGEGDPSPAPETGEGGDENQTEGETGGETEGQTPEEPFAIHWESSDEGVARVDGGSVEAIAAGDATITASVKNPLDESKTLTARCRLHVAEDLFAAPKLQSASPTSDGRAELKWEATGAESFGVYELVNGIEVLRATVSEPNVTLCGVTGGEHTYVVRPRFRVGLDWLVGEPSNSLSMTVEEWKTPAAMRSVTEAEGNGATVKWSPVSGATKYRIYDLRPDDSLRFLRETSDTSAVIRDLRGGWHSFVVRAVVNGAEGNVSYPLSLRLSTVTLRETKIRIVAGSRRQLHAELNEEEPSADSNQLLTWTSSDPYTLLVDESGWLTALDVGSATVRVETVTGDYAECSVEIAASESTRAGDFWIDNGMVTAYYGDAEVVEIPEGVIGIAASAFYHEKYIRKVIIPEGVVVIKDYAFYNCERLEKVCMPDGLREIGERAFEDCEVLWSADIPSSVRSIGARAFSGCESLTSVTIPEGVTDIYEYTFYRCLELRKAVLPSTLRYVGTSAFHDCWQMECDKLPDGLEEVDWRAFAECTSLELDELPPRLTKLAPYAFLDVKLKKINIPEGVETLPNGVFSGCETATNVTFPKSLKKIESSALSGCGFESIEIPSTVTEIESGIFGGCENLKEVKLPLSLTTITDQMFSHCTSLEKITLPESITAIDFMVFWDCDNLQEIVLPGRLQKIGATAFIGCFKLSYIVIPSSVTEIGDTAFGDYIVYGPGDEKITPLPTLILCEEGSYAEEWAKKVGRTYRCVDLPPAGDIVIGSGMTLDLRTVMKDPKHLKTFYSDDPEVATVQNDYLLHGVRPGSTSVADESRAEVIGVTVVGFEEPWITLPVGGTGRMEPVDLTGTWSSSNEKIAKVDEAGNVTGVSTGSATIMLTRDDGVWSCYTARVGEKAKEIWTSPAYLILHPGDSRYVAPNLPPNQYATGYTYESNDSKIAAVDANGLVTAVAPGRTKIFVSSADDPRVKASCDVAVLLEGYDGDVLLQDVKKAYQLLLSGYGMFDGGFYDGSGRWIEPVDMSAVTDSAAAKVYDLLGAKTDILTFGNVADVSYLTEKVLTECSELVIDVNRVKDALKETFNALGLTSSLLTSFYKIMKIDEAAASGTVDLRDVKKYEEWFSNLEKDGELNYMQLDKNTIKPGKIGVAVMEGVIKAVRYMCVDMKRIIPIIAQLKESDGMLRDTGLLLEAVTKSPAATAIYVATSLGFTKCEKEALKMLVDIGWKTLESIPVVGWAFYGAEQGAKFGYAVANGIMNVDKIQAAAFKLEKAIHSAKSYKATFEAAYEQFIQNPVNPDNYSNFFMTAQLFGMLVSTEYSEFEDCATQTYDSLASRVIALFSREQHDKHDQVRTVNDVGRYCKTQLCDNLEMLNRACDGLDPIP